MKTAHRKAARHKRRWQADPAAMGRVFARIQPYTDAEQAHVSIPARMGMSNILHGKGTTDDLDAIAYTVNATLVLSETTHPECVNVCLDAASAVIAAKNRWRKFGSIGFDGLGLQAVQHALDLHEEFLKHINPATHAAALREVLRRIDAGKFLEQAA